MNYFQEPTRQLSSRSLLIALLHKDKKSRKLSNKAWER